MLLDTPADTGPATLVRRIGRLVTMTEAGVVEDAAVVIAGERIAWAGRDADLPEDVARRVTATHDAGGGLVTPGLIDAHTHPVYVAPRAAEIARRLDGASYQEIATSGGGIGATIRATRAATPDVLEPIVARRLAAWRRAGTTTAEVKTGYHLERDGELGALELLGRVDASGVGPSLVRTFLAGHDLPPGWDGDRGDYVRLAAGWSGAAAVAGARFCDVFCDAGYFTVDEAEVILAAGRAAGLGVRLHADELDRTGGSLLAARLRATSADHLLRANDEDARAMAAAGVVATLCPGTAASLRRLPPVEAFRAAGVRIALGTDHNPGTSGLDSMTTAVTLAVVVLGLSLTEALRAATTGGAASLGLDDRGAVAAGLRADLVAWDADHEGAFGWSWTLPTRTVWVGGAS